MHAHLSSQPSSSSSSGSSSSSSSSRPAQPTYVGLGCACMAITLCCITGTGRSMRRVATLPTCIYNRGTESEIYSPRYYSPHSSPAHTHTTTTTTTFAGSLSCRCAEKHGDKIKSGKKTPCLRNFPNSLPPHSKTCRHHRPAKPSQARPSPAQPSPAQPSLAQPNAAQPNVATPAQPSPAQPTPAPAHPSPTQPNAPRRSLA